MCQTLTDVSYSKYMCQTLTDVSYSNYMSQTLTDVSYSKYMSQTLTYVSYIRYGSDTLRYMYQTLGIYVMQQIYVSYIRNSCQTFGMYVTHTSCRTPARCATYHTSTDVSYSRWTCPKQMVVAYMRYRCVIR